MLNIIFKKKKTFFIDKLYKDLYPTSIISIDKLYKDLEPNEILNINSVTGHNRSQYNHVTGVTLTAYSVSFIYT